MLEIKTPIPSDPMMKIKLNPTNTQKLPGNRYTEKPVSQDQQMQTG